MTKLKPSPKIKPCPWCGKEPKSIKGDEMDLTYIECRPGKGHSVYGPDRKNKRSAVLAWMVGLFFVKDFQTMRGTAV